MRRRGRDMTRVHHLPYFLVLVVQGVRQLRLLEARGRHPLVHRAAGRIRRVEARLDQRLSRLRGDHRLQLPRREGVDVARLARHQQHHLSSCQRRQFVGLTEKGQQSAAVGRSFRRSESDYLFHDARLSLGEGGVPPQLVVDELHLDLHAPLGLLAIGRRGLLVLRPILTLRRPDLTQRQRAQVLVLDVQVVGRPLLRRRVG